ncbi:MAG: ATP-binding cassette domain-containing protein, partial [Litorivicinaceae bacterium]
MEIVVSDSMVQNTNQVEGRAVPEKTLGNIHVDNPRMTARNVDVFYGDKHAIDNISLDIGASQVISFIGPSGCGKSTFLRCLNRMNDTIDICKVEGEIKIDQQNIYDPAIDVVSLRARVG